LNGTSFFRDVISPELEELIKERGTDLQAFYEWKACFSIQAPLVTSAHTFSHLGGYDDIKGKWTP
jgi:hypothetical protein